MPEETRTRCFGSPDDPLMMSYHDNEWGVPVHDDRKQFEFLCLESMQSGLSWKTILDKRENFRKAFSSFDPVEGRRLHRRRHRAPDVRRGHCPQPTQNRGHRQQRPALPGGPERVRLLRPLHLAIHGLTRPCVGTTSTCPPRPPSPRPLSKDLRVRGFKFMGPIVVYSHMQATGQVNDHHPTCFRAPRNSE